MSERIIDTGMTQQELNKILDDVSKLIQSDCDRQPGEFTAREYADRHGIEPDEAREVLDRAVRRKAIARRPGRNKNRPAVWYRIA